MVVAVAMSVPGVALAQSQGPAYLNDRRVAEGAGIRVGNLELHPGVGAELGYDSNFLMRTNKNPPPNFVNSPPLESARLRVTPSLSLSTLGPQRLEGQSAEPPSVTMRATAALTYMEFFGPPVIRDQRNVSANLRLQMSIAPGRPLGASVTAGYARIILPNTTGNPDFAFTQNRPDGGIDLVLNPGGGTLEYRVGYHFMATLYETRGSVQFNSMQHTGALRGRWRFNPRNSLFSEATVGRNLYTARRPGSPLADSTPLTARVGLDGLFTTNLGGTFSVGWGQTYFDKADNPNTRDFDSFTANARLTYYLTPNPDGEDVASQLSTFVANISAQYSRSFQFSLVTNGYTLDRGELGFNSFFGGKANLSLSAGIAAVQYPDFFATFNPALFLRAGTTDVRPDATAFFEYRFTDTIGANLTLRYMQNISKVQLQQDPVTTDVFDFNFTRFEAFLGARWFM